MGYDFIQPFSFYAEKRAVFVFVWKQPMILAHKREIFMSKGSDDSFSDLLVVEGINAKGFGNLPKVVMFDLDLTIEAKAIYAYFCSFAGRGSTAFPGRDKILFDLQVGKNSYYRHFKLLTGQGYILVKQRMVNNLKSQNLYSLVSSPKKFAEAQDVLKKEEQYSLIRTYGLRKLGYGQIPKIVMQDRRLDIKSKGIYAFFACLLGNGDTVAPRRDDILFYLKIAHGAYEKYLQMLIDFGYITKVQLHSGLAFGRNEFTLTEFPDKEKMHVQLGKGGRHPRTVKVVRGPLDRGNANALLGQRAGNEYAENEYAENGYTGGNTKTAANAVIQSSQQRAENGDAENQYAENGPSKINNTKNKQYLKSIDQTALKATEKTEGHHDAENQSKETTDRRPSTKAALSRADAEALVLGAVRYPLAGENNSNGPAGENDFEQAVFDLFTEALVSMMSSGDQMSFNSTLVSSEMIYDKFKQCASQTAGCLSVSELAKAASGDYIDGLTYNLGQGTDIRNKVRYMESCIWNAFLVGKAGILNPPVSPTAGQAVKRGSQSAKKNRFVNFEQREIDFDQYEKMELQLLLQNYQD